MVMSVRRAVVHVSGRIGRVEFLLSGVSLMIGMHSAIVMRVGSVL